MAGSIRKITLFHIQDKNRIDPDKLARLDEFNESDRHRLQSLVSVLQTAGAGEVDIKLSLGSPSAEVIHFVKEQNVSLTIMGSQGRGFIQEVFLGSVSNNVARHSSASVLLIPAERQ